jgi:PAS domain S-box-containing protein
LIIPDPVELATRFEKFHKMINNKLLKILFVEDEPFDVDLAVFALRKEKLTFEYKTVCTGFDLLNALKDFNPDLVISDYNMPAFNGQQALREVLKFNPELPFILFTGSVNEETAVECIKSGAQDYVIKEHLTRLPFAVKEALEQVRINKEKKASELLLKDNEEKLQSIFSAAPVGIGLVVNRTFIEVNDAFCVITGYSRRELIGKSSELIYSSIDEFINVGKEKYQQIDEKGKSSVETTFKHKDGKIINVIISSAPLDKKNYSKGVTFTILDITERKRYEEALKESQQLFRTLSQVSPVGIFKTDYKGYTTYVNPKWQELSGLTFEEAIGFGWINAVHPDDREAIKNRWNSDVNSQVPSVAEYRFLRPDGSITWVMGNAVLEDKDDESTGYIGTITDITERKLVENALVESETKYRMIFENVQDLYYETSLDGTILTVSPSIETLSKGQYRKEDLIGKSIYDFYSDINERTALIEQISEKGTISDFEIMLINKDGTIVPCSASSKIIFDTKGHPEKIIGSMHDITDQKKATEVLKIAIEKAESSDRLKSEFLNNISHEVRTPLNGILGFAEIISMQDLSEKDKKDSLALLFESSNRLLNTITNYMDISLIASGSLTVNKRDFVPAAMLKDIFDNFEAVCQIRHLDYVLEIPPEHEKFVLNSDPEICQKIISHFIDNAIKFTEKGSIHFGFNLLSDQLEFFVKDTGIGISIDSLDSIFDRFVKDKHNPYEVSEGSGLGLSISKGMSDAIGGKIRVESEQGVGSFFCLTIPMRTDFEKFVPSVPGNDIKESVKGCKILVAEDDYTNFYYLNALLNNETSAHILHAVNGKEAVELFRSDRNIKLILMDIKMPEVDGFEATRQIKKIDKNVPVIAITAYAMSGDEERIISAGFDGYLSKPLNKKSLLKKMEEFIILK